MHRTTALALTAALSASALLVGCAATESSRTLEVAQTQAAARPYAGPRVPVSVGKFDNRSSFMRGVFSDGVDRLGSQAKTSLVAHLQQSQRFSVLDRDNLAEAKQEAQFQGAALATRGADYVITGDIVEFGRKEVGDKQFFGVLGRGKSQVAYAKVTLNVVDVRSSEVVFSSGGAGEYELSNREVLGFGSTASYDATLNGKVLDLAMRQAVDALAALLAGCATPVPPLYDWGDFPRQQYEILLRQGADPNAQIAAMQAQAQEAQAGNRALPPGFRAHLGMLQLSVGRADEARSLWQAEKAAFPESEAFMDRLLRKLAAPATRAPALENPA